MSKIMELAEYYATLREDGVRRELEDEARAALQAEVEELEKELNTLDVMLEECKMDWSGDVTQIKVEHKHEVDALREKLAAVEKDAARMDWLDKYAHIATWVEHDPIKLVIDAASGNEFTGDTWRDAIDAAMEATK